MNERNQHHSSTAYWTVTGITGAVATAAVTVIMGSVMSAPAHSAPVSYMPADPGIVSATSEDRPATDARGCFMGQHNWHQASGSMPQCPVG